MTDYATADGCPGPINCPLYVLAHDVSTSHLGCVKDMAKPCEGSGDPAKFQAMVDRAWDEILAGLRARLGVSA